MICLYTINVFRCLCENRKHLYNDEKTSYQRWKCYLKQTEFSNNLSCAWKKSMQKMKHLRISEQSKIKKSERVIGSCYKSNKPVSYFTHSNREL